MIGSCAPVLSTYIPQRLGPFSITHYLDSLTEVMTLDDIIYQRPQGTNVASRPRKLTHSF